MALFEKLRKHATTREGRRHAASVLAADLKEFFCYRRFTLPPEIGRSRCLTRALDTLKTRWPELDAPETGGHRPVFVLSAGWRSGSTLVQRLVMSSREVAVWGEPLGQTGVVQRIGLGMAAINDRFPGEDFFDPEPDMARLSGRWSANLTPPMADFREAQRDFFLRWLAVPAMERYGAGRWGFKDVRLTIDHARYLKWLFPGARFLFVYRNPYHAFRSWKGNRWRDTWPGYCPWSAAPFTRHWRRLLSGFFEGYEEVGGMMVKFEDLTRGRIPLTEIARHIGVEQLDPAVLERKVSGVREPLKHKPRLNFWDRAVVRTLGGRFLESLGYRP